MDLSSLSSPVFENTLAAIIGACILGSITFIIRRTKDKLAEQKYSLRGEYRAVYEDVLEDGSILYEKSIINLKQKGLKIEAVDYDEATGKDWEFSGEIDPLTGKVYGHYRTVAHGDSGLAVCIFEQKPDGVLDGFWTGYDSSIQDIDHGRYILTRRLDVKIRAAGQSDILPVLQLLDQELGEDWIYADDLKKAIANDMLYVAEHNGNLAGFTLLRLLKKDEFIKELKGQKYKLPRDIDMANENETIGFIEAIATDPAYQGKGVGTKLVDKSLTRLKKAGAEMVTAMGWKPEQVNIGPTLTAAGFKDRAEFERFWYNESLEDDAADCPGCGKPPCECGAVLFSKAI